MGSPHCGQGTVPPAGAAACATGATGAATGEGAGAGGAGATGTGAIRGGAACGEIATVPPSGETPGKPATT
jgi:hypothetical protein